MRHQLFAVISSLVFAFAALCSFFYSYFHGPQGHEIIAIILMIVFLFVAFVSYQMMQCTKRIFETYDSFRNVDCANRYLAELSEEKLNLFASSLSKEGLEVEISKVKDYLERLNTKSYSSQLQHDMSLRDTKRILKRLEASK